MQNYSVSRVWNLNISVAQFLFNQDFLQSLCKKVGRLFSINSSVWICKVCPHHTKSFGKTSCPFKIVHHWPSLRNNTSLLMSHKLWLIRVMHFGSWYEPFFRIVWFDLDDRYLWIWIFNDPLNFLRYSSYDIITYDS